MFVAFLKILKKKHDRITGSHIRRKFLLQTLNHMDFVLYASAVNEDAVLAEQNSRPKHEIRYTRLVPTKITNYSRAESRVIVNHPPDHHHQLQRIHLL